MNIPVIKLRPTAILPTYQTKESVGMDVHADIEEEITIKPLGRVQITTGISVAIPDGYEAQIRARSGLAFRLGLFCLNAPGTIDSDYRGEIKVLLANMGDAPIIIHPGMRIAQMIISPVERCSWDLRKNLSKTKRGKGGFGSTGFYVKKPDIKA